MEAWLDHPSPPGRPHSPFSEGETVVSGFQPLGFEDKRDDLDPSRRESGLPSEKPRTCGLPRRYFIGVIILIWVILLAIGLGVGLGVGLKKKHSDP